MSEAHIIILGRLNEGQANHETIEANIANNAYAGEQLEAAQLVLGDFEKLLENEIGGTYGASLNTILERQLELI